MISVRFVIGLYYLNEVYEFYRFMVIDVWFLMLIFFGMVGCYNVCSFFLDVSVVF